MSAAATCDARYAAKTSPKAVAGAGTIQYPGQGDGWLFGDARADWVTRTETFGQSRYSFSVVLCATVPL